MKRSTLFEVALGAVLAAGVVGVARQRRERDRVVRGELAPATAAAHVIPVGRQGPVARWASTWVPPRPSSPLGRALAVAWAAPATVVGAAIGLTTGGRARWVPEHGCVVIEGGRGGSVRLLRAVGASANAIGHVVVSRHEHTPDLLLAHEAAHVRQAERLGPLLALVYVWWWARYGYRDHPLERGAREAARRWRNAEPRRAS